MNGATWPPGTFDFLPQWGRGAEVAERGAGSWFGVLWRDGANLECGCGAAAFVSLVMSKVSVRAAKAHDPAESGSCVRASLRDRSPYRPVARRGILEVFRQRACH